MGDADPSLPAAIPWYRSANFQGIIVSLIVQTVAHTPLAAHVTQGMVTTGVNWGLEGVSWALAAYALHARAKKHLPAIAISRPAADKINAAVAAAPAAVSDHAPPFAQPLTDIGDDHP